MNGTLAIGVEAEDASGHAQHVFGRHPGDRLGIVLRMVWSQSVDGIEGEMRRSGMASLGTDGEGSRSETNRVLQFFDARCLTHEPIDFLEDARACAFDFLRRGRDVDREPSTFEAETVYARLWRSRRSRKRRPPWPARIWAINSSV